MRLRYITITLLLLVACNSGEPAWQPLSCGPFQVKAPLGWRTFEYTFYRHPEKGITNGQDTLYYEYEKYDLNPGKYSGKIFSYAQDTINGLVAGFRKYGTDDDAITLHIPHAYEMNNFLIYGSNLSDKNLVLRILKTITFPNSDTSQNPPLLAEKFKQEPVLSGKNIFQMNCASCHHIYKIVTGPALQDVFKKRDDDWILKFLSDSSFMAQNSTPNEYGGHTLFPAFTKPEVAVLREYIHDQETCVRVLY